MKKKSYSSIFKHEILLKILTNKINSENCVNYYIIFGKSYMIHTSLMVTGIFNVGELSVGSSEDLNGFCPSYKRNWNADDADVYDKI